MEGNSAFVPRNKRKLQSDAESRRRRHKGGMQINHQHKNDADIRMETIIYKLDSSNKIVLPMAHETNTDRDFLKYVQTYLEQASLSDNLGGRCSILDKPKVKHERARNSKRLSYESDTTIEEQKMPKTIRRRRSSGRNTRTGRDVAADEDAITYLYEKRPSESVNRKAKICSCQPRLQYNVDGSFIVPKEAAFTRVASVARDNGQTACELSEEQMLRCFQLVFKQLCTLNNVDGTVMNIDVATPTESPLRSIHNPTSNVQNSTSYEVIENTTRHSYTPSSPAIYNQLPPQAIAPLPAYTENYMMPETALEATTQPPAVTHQERQPRQQSQTEPLIQSHSGKTMSQEQFFYPSQPKSTFTEPVEIQVLGKQFDTNNEPLPLQLPNRTGSYNDDPTKRHPFLAAQQTNEMQLQHSQQQNNQRALAGQMNQHHYAGQEQHQQQQHQSQQQQQQHHHQQQQQQLLHNQQQHQHLQQLHQQQQPQQQQQGDYQRRRSSYRNSEARESTFMENYPTEFDWERMIPLHRLSSARQSTATPTAQELEGVAGTGMNRQQQGAGRQTNFNYPMYPFGQRDGLQDITADNVRVIPNIRVVDYSENDCGVPNCAPGDNESYEYILMRVKKKKLHCP